MRKTQTLVVTSCVVALAIGCSTRADEGGLVLTPGDPKTSIEARYSEGDHVLVFRSKLDNGNVTTDIVDGKGHSLSHLATSVIEHPPIRSAKGELSIPVAALISNATEIGTALRLSQHGIRQLRDAIPSDAAEAAVFKQLSRQTSVMRTALTQLRLVLLQEWGSEARRHITMTPEEHAKFFAILNRQAATIAGKAKTGRTPAAARMSHDAEIETLLGADRYAQYKTRRTAWLAPVGETALELVP